jgi:hypothetical protein
VLKIPFPFWFLDQSPGNPVDENRLLFIDQMRNQGKTDVVKMTKDMNLKMYPQMRKVNTQNGKKFYNI